ARAENSGDHRLVAYLVAAEAAPETAELRDFMQQTLPDYMLPSAFVFLPELPLTPSGKLDRRALPKPELNATGEHYVAPRTPAEQTLAGIWEEVIGHERVGINDNFFELGGHSLLAIKVLSRIRNSFGVELSMSVLFEEPVLRDLAAQIDATRRSDS